MKSLFPRRQVALQMAATTASGIMCNGVAIVNSTSLSSTSVGFFSPVSCASFLRSAKHRTRLLLLTLQQGYGSCGNRGKWQCMRRLCVVLKLCFFRFVWQFDVFCFFNYLSSSHKLFRSSSSKYVMPIYLQCLSECFSN